MSPGGYRSPRLAGRAACDAVGRVTEPPLLRSWQPLSLGCCWRGPLSAPSRWDPGRPRWPRGCPAFFPPWLAERSSGAGCAWPSASQGVRARRRGQQVTRHVSARRRRLSGQRRGGSSGRVTGSGGGALSWGCQEKVEGPSAGGGLAGVAGRPPPPGALGAVFLVGRPPRGNERFGARGGHVAFGSGSSCPSFWRPGWPVGLGEENGPTSRQLHPRPARRAPCAGLAFRGAHVWAEPTHPRAQSEGADARPCAHVSAGRTSVEGACARTRVCVGLGGLCSCVDLRVGGSSGREPVLAGGPSASRRPVARTPAWCAVSPDVALPPALCTRTDLATGTQGPRQGRALR